MAPSKECSDGRTAAKMLRRGAPLNWLVYRSRRNDEKDFGFRRQIDRDAKVQEKRSRAQSNTMMGKKIDGRVGWSSTRIVDGILGPEVLKNYLCRTSC